MFADISGSTQLYETLGDEAAKQAIDKCLTRLRGIIAGHDGIVIKSIGDELMCRFERAEDAVRTAVAVQTETGSLPITGDHRLAIRAGIHYGEVIEDEDDIFGDAVNVAARMTGIARAGQILTTAATLAELPQESGLLLRQIDFTEIKGKQEKVAVYEVLWESQDRITRVSGDLLARIGSNVERLKLTYGNNSCELGEARKSVTLGRSSDCDLVVATELASRQHAVIAFRRGKFVVTDQGTNGTYVATDSGQEVFLRREDFILHGQGRLSLGKPLTACSDAEVIYFKC